MSSPREQSEAPEAPEVPLDDPASAGASGPQAVAEDGPEQGTAADAAAPGPDDELGRARAEAEGLTNDLKRLQAEYVNYKRRVERDRELVLQNARFSVLAAMLPVLDDVDRAREHGELTGGFKAVADALERAVTSQGLVRFGSPGDPFDPRFHEALMHSHSAEVTSTTCQHIISAGYQIGERVVRPAQVAVVDPAPEGTAEPAGTSEPAEPTGGTSAER